jgi:hypothetical protein
VRWGPLLIVLGACGELPKLAPPRLADPIYPETYNTRIANLRTTLGRAGIALRVAGIDETFETASGVRCDLAGQATQLDGAVLEAATHAFSLYPTDVLAASKIKYVAVCRDIAQFTKLTHPAGLADLRDSGMLISVRYFLDRTYYSDSDFTVDDIVHHEVFHLVEAAHDLDDMTRDPEWQLYNPMGFEYAEDSADRRDGFVNAYAMTSAVEDKASVYEFMMARSLDLCRLAKDDETIRQKAKIVWRRMLKNVGTDKFLRDHAPCIDWLET